MAAPAAAPRPPAAAGRPYSLHLFVCTTGSDCPRDGPALAIRAAVKAAARERGLADAVRVNASGCLNQCGHGPMMVVYPEGAWYAHLDELDALRVFEAHLAGDLAAVADLRYRLGPGKNQAALGADGRRHCAGGCRGAPAAPP